MTNVQTVDQVLDHIDLERWGYRKAELVRLVAALQEGPNPAPLGRKLLMAMGRTGRQARYDHDLLVGLVDDRVLIRWRGEGRRPDCWAVTDVERWRGIRWVTPRRDVIRAFSSPIPGAAVALWTKRAGHASRCVPTEALNEAVGDAGLSANRWSTTPRPLDTTPRPTLGKPVDMVHNTTAGGGAVYASRSLTRSSSSSSQEEEEGTIATEAEKRLVRAVATAIGVPDLWGAPLRAVLGAARAHPERVEALIAWCPSLSGVKSPARAAQLVDGAAEMSDLTPITGPGVPAELLAANLRQRIATLEAYNDQDDNLPAMRAELAELESSLPVPGQA